MELIYLCDYLYSLITLFDYLRSHHLDPLFSIEYYSSNDFLFLSFDWEFLGLPLAF